MWTHNTVDYCFELSLPPWIHSHFHREIMNSMKSVTIMMIDGVCLLGVRSSTQGMDWAPQRLWWLQHVRVSCTSFFQTVREMYYMLCYTLTAVVTAAPLLIPLSTCGVIERVSCCQGGHGHHVIEFFLVSQSATKHSSGQRVNILSTWRQTQQQNNSNTAIIYRLGATK